MSYFSPQYFHFIALLFADKLRPCFLLSIGCFLLFMLLNTWVSAPAQQLLHWLPIFFLLAAIEWLILAAFLVFFRELHSVSANSQSSIAFYRAKEWLEVVLFSILLPMPVVIAFMIIISIN